MPLNSLCHNDARWLLTFPKQIVLYHTHTIEGCQNILKLRGTSFIILFRQFRIEFAITCRFAEANESILHNAINAEQDAVLVQLVRAGFVINIFVLYGKREVFKRIPVLLGDDLALFAVFQMQDDEIKYQIADCSQNSGSYGPLKVHILNLWGFEIKIIRIEQNYFLSKLNFKHLHIVFIKLLTFTFFYYLQVGETIHHSFSKYCRKIVCVWKTSKCFRHNGIVFVLSNIRGSSYFVANLQLFVDSINDGL